MLFPGLRLGYVVAPPSLREVFRAVKWLADRGSPALEQQAIASLLESGLYESTRRRTVRRLTEKRDGMVAAIRSRFPDGEVDVGGASSGTHLFLSLSRIPANATDSLIAAAQKKGVRVYSALPYYRRRPRHAVVMLGYTTVEAEDIEQGVERLAAAYAGYIRGPRVRDKE
jgi:GntR family transcriptional regulator/MocR family aminotransferase